MQVHDRRPGVDHVVHVHNAPHSPVRWTSPARLAPGPMRPAALLKGERAAAAHTICRTAEEQASRALLTLLTLLSC